MSTMTQARVESRITAAPWAIIMSRVTERVLSSPYSTMPRESPTSSRSTCGSSRRSEEHTSELQSLMRISYAVFCLKKKKLTESKSTRRYTLTTTKDQLQQL